MTQPAKTESQNDQNTRLLEPSSSAIEKNAQHAYYDQSQVPRYLCVAGLGFSWAISLFCIIFGAVKARRDDLEIDYDDDSWGMLKDILILLQTAVLLLCQESLGYIHTVSLRWALQREKKLEFSSNLRLWQNASTTGPNAWYGNLAVVVGQVATFGSSVMTLDKESESGSYWIWFLPEAWITLGLGLAIQAGVATWAMFSWREWPTWSSDPLDVAAACLDQGTVLLERRPGRALQGLGQARELPKAMLPLKQQQGVYAVHKDVRQATIPLWIIFGLCSIWTIAVFAAIASHGLVSELEFDNWNPFGSPGYSISIPLFDSVASGDSISGKDYVWLFFFIGVLQSAIALACHFAELHVNLARDEAAWRETSSKKGHRRTTNPLAAVFGSWQSVVLLLLKLGIQWFFGVTFSIDTYDGIFLYGPQTLYLTILILALASYATALVLYQPRGPQPTTFGHLQTLVDLIDAWPGREEVMYWGDKGKYDNQDLRKAGTSVARLPPIDLDAKYV